MTMPIPLYVALVFFSTVCYKISFGVLFTLNLVLNQVTAICTRELLVFSLCSQFFLYFYFFISGVAFQLSVQLP